MENSRFKRNILKLYMSIKGYFKEKKFKKGKTYRGGSANRLSIYRGNRTFYEQNDCTDPKYGVTIFNTINKQYPYWQFGILDWSEENNVEIIK